METVGDAVLVSRREEEEGGEEGEEEEGEGEEEEKEEGEEKGGDAQGATPATPSMPKPAPIPTFTRRLNRVRCASYTPIPAYCVGACLSVWAQQPAASSLFPRFDPQRGSIFFRK